jgi:mono/diheme cytochrome c family protein
VTLTHLRQWSSRSVGRTVPTGVLIGLAIVMGACGSDTSTLPATADASGQGAEVYASSCASCHGADLRGTEKGPSQLSIVYEPNHHGDDSYRSAIANGAPQHHWSFGDMAPVEGLSDDDVEAVIAYIRSEQQRQGFE